MSTQTLRLTRDEEKGGWVYGSGGESDSCIKMGSNESHFNVWLIVRYKITRQCRETTIFEEKRELKRI